MSQTNRNQQIAGNPVGAWEWQAGQIAFHMVFNADGTGSFNGQSIKWQLNQGVMSLNDGVSTIQYNASLSADSLTLSGGNLPQALTFHRVSQSDKDAGEAPPSEEANPVGSWEREANGRVYRLLIKPDGSGLLDSIAFQWKLDQGTLLFTAGNDTLTYKASFAENSMTLVGANLQQPTVWKRAPGSSASAPKSGAQGKPQSGTGLVGKWQGPDGVVQINANSTINIGGETYAYKVQKNIITIIGNDGSIQIPFELNGDTLSVNVNGQTKTLHRISDELPQAGRGGSSPQELAGKWCYLSSSSTYGGSRISDSCFTLYANGTYEYYGESSTSVQAGSVASQQSDSGSWSATETTITAHSRTRGTTTYSLQKKNHPKNGDPMLVIDGQWFVTYNQRPPWR